MIVCVLPVRPSFSVPSIVLVLWTQGVMTVCSSDEAFIHSGAIFVLWTHSELVPEYSTLGHTHTQKRKKKRKKVSLRTYFVSLPTLTNSLTDSSTHSHTHSHTH